MEMEQWDNGDDLYHENLNTNTVNNDNDNNNGDSSHHQNQNDDEYNNQQNDYSNQYNNNYNDYNDNNKNYNNYNNDSYSNYNNRGYNNNNNNDPNYNVSRNNNNYNNNYRTNTYRRQQYNQYDNNRGYNRNRGGYRGNKYGYKPRHKQYDYQHKRDQYQQRRHQRQYQPKHVQQNQYQHQNESQPYNQHQRNDNIQYNDNEKNESKQSDEATQIDENIESETHNTSNRGSRGSRPSRPNRNRFGSRNKQKFKRTIENNIDYEESQHDETKNNDQYNDQSQSLHEPSNKSNDKTQYIDESEAQIMRQTDTYYSHSNQSGYNKHGYSEKKPQRQQNAMELENLSARGKKMALQLINGNYECAVCFKKVGKHGRIWKCTHCFKIFHLTCINQWARTKEDNDAKSQQRATKPNHEITTLKCPACNFIDTNFKYDEYKCYCSKVIFDHIHRNRYNYDSFIPHSCGDICGRSRGTDCPHSCPSECHPGPCEPCKLPSNRKGSCPCGKLKYSLLCGQIETAPRLCQQICDKLLKCGNHGCTAKCHDGECKQCDIKIEQECFCGKQKKLRPCGTGIKMVMDIVSSDNNNENEENEEKQVTIWKYSCTKICNKSLSCGHHKCTLICHNGSCSVCPRRIETPTRCACGKNVFNDIQRISCLDKLPICDKKCGRMLGCGQHFCCSTCHDSKCKICGKQIKKKCRCGASEKRFKCHDYQKKLQQFIATNLNSNMLAMEGQDSWIRCGKKCKRVKSCGKHICSEICCRGRSIRTYFEGHRCNEICNKPLSCGRHRCSSYCHRGQCNPCGVTYRNGVQCACGNVYVAGPFQCGTKLIPTCTSTCDKVLGCGHRCASKCHHGQCPNCIRICSKPCISHGLLVHNMPCHVENRSCGNPCGQVLLCGIHRCNRTCHTGSCIIANNKNNDLQQHQQSKGCGQICNLILKCGHKCQHKCHQLISIECNSDSCKVQINVKCKCGNTSETQYCRGRSEYELKAVPCTEQCQIAERNKRFREALNIKTINKRSDNKQNIETNSEKKENNSNAERIPFAASVLKRILKWMHEDKGHTMIIKQDKKIIAPKFVYYIEGLLNTYICDKSQDGHIFKSQYTDITVLTSRKSSESAIINLKPMNSEQRFIVYSMMTHYHIRVEKKENSGFNGLSYLELSKTKHSRIADYLLSTALIEYQIRSEQIETLESMPPETIIVIDNGLNISSSKIQDRLLAWTGDYRMYRKKNGQQIFIVFTDENARNSAMTEMKKFGARKAIQSDSLNADIAHKQQQQQRKKKLLKLKQQQQQHNNNNNTASTNTSNTGWCTVGNAHSMSINNMTKQKPENLNIKMNNRFG